MMRLRGGESQCCGCDGKPTGPKLSNLKMTKVTTAPLLASVPEQTSKPKPKPQEPKQQNYAERDRYDDRRHESRDAGRESKDDRYERERDDYYDDAYYAPPPPQHYGRHHGHRGPHFGRRDRGRRPRYGPMYGPPRFYGFGPRTDERMERTMGDAVNTVLAKVEEVNERIRVST